MYLLDLSVDHLLLIMNAIESREIVGDKKHITRKEDKSSQ
jgi:hypothetical protein